MKINEYAPGAPCWADLMTTDLEAAKRFYPALLGWEPHPTSEEFGGYHMCRLGGDEVVGLGRTMAPDQPAAWAIYFATNDAEASANKVEAAGGKVLAAPTDVGEAGRMAQFLDPSGAAFAVWQAGEFAGAGKLEEPGAISWAELVTRDTGRAGDFYRQVFGWSPTSADVGMPYTMFNLGDRPVAGMMAMTPDQFPAEVPAHWMLYFEVADTDATAANAARLGGRVTHPPTDIEPGRFAVLNDPQGAVFSIVRTNPNWMMYG
jgi:uncharacterized protein